MIGPPCEVTSHRTPFPSSHLVLSSFSFVFDDVKQIHLAASLQQFLGGSPWDFHDVCSICPLSALFPCVMCSLRPCVYFQLSFFRGDPGGLAWGLASPSPAPPQTGATFMLLFRLFPQTEIHVPGIARRLARFFLSQTQVDWASFHVIRLCRRADRPLGHPFLGVQPLETPPLCEELSRTLPCVLLAQGLSSRLPGFTSLSRHPSPYPPSCRSFLPPSF